jgi:Hemolysin activation/secretion protein
MPIVLTGCSSLPPGHRATIRRRADAWERKASSLVLKRLQNALIARGYVTSKVAAAGQDLKSGELAVTLTPGRIHSIGFAPGTKPGPRLSAALPVRPGEVQK